MHGMELKIPHLLKICCTACTGHAGFRSIERNNKRATGGKARWDKAKGTDVHIVAQAWLKEGEGMASITGLVGHVAHPDT